MNRLNETLEKLNKFSQLNNYKMFNHEHNFLVRKHKLAPINLG